ncbi:MAG TPA: beta-eliminating lyase-related protein [Steroidobacteraceae bacterium]|nr:beta-eliminating lyase-related protein [Steroidobacteraceae bacterium]
MDSTMNFGSDNQAGASQQVIDAVIAANVGNAHGYGSDPWTERATNLLRETFQRDLEALFVPTGTAANSLALSCLAQPWEVILCHNHAHILNDEATAPEFFTGGARLIGISGRDGKLEPRHLSEYFKFAGKEYPHNSRATVLSMTQASENGLVYTPDEIAALSSLAKKEQLKIQMDGARFANAVAALKYSPADISWKAGVDVLCLGATKNGALACEVVLFFDKKLSEQFVYRRKRAGHLISKSRFIGAQMEAWLKDRYWLKLASHANECATKLSKELASIPRIRITWPTQANEVFVVLPIKLVERLRTAGAEFYEWPLTGLPPEISITRDEAYVRLVTSFLTTDKEISDFCAIAHS